jgi:hypothetical protein
MIAPTIGIYYMNDITRRFFRLQDLTLLAALLVIAGFFLVLRPMLAEPGATAVVTLDGEEIMRVPLNENDDYRIDLLADYGVPVSFEVTNGGLRFVDVTCPDHVCEKTGVIREEGQTAVCMPNLVAAVVVGVS